MTEGTDSTSVNTYDMAQSYNILTDGFWGYLQSQKRSDLVKNIGLRDASASKNPTSILQGLY